MKNKAQNQLIMKRSLLCFLLVALFLPTVKAQEKILSIKLNEPESITFSSLLSMDPTAYNQTDGRIAWVVSGGTVPYTYNWLNASGVVIKTGQVNTQGTRVEVRTGAGAYRLQIIDENNCTGVSNSHTLVAPPELKVTLSQTASINCFGQATAALKATATGGVGSYRYSWKKNGVAYSGSLSTISNLEAGVYEVTITDGNNIVKRASKTLVQPARLTATVVPTNILCKGSASGKATLTVSGGTPPYRYIWSGGQTTKDLVNVLAGTHTVTITDSKNCTVTISTTITEPATGMELTLASLTAPTAYGRTDGAVDIQITGGSTPYVYRWSNGKTTQDLQNVGDGTYTVTVTDTKGCTIVENFEVKEPELLKVNIVEQSPVACYGTATAALYADVTGGVKIPGVNYRYQWYLMSGATAQPIAGATSAILSNRARGKYQVKIADNNNVEVRSADFILVEPTPLVAVKASHTDVGCYGENTGAIALDVSGGTPPYTYKWSHGVTTKNVSGLKPGSYHVEVSDSRGCMQNVSATIVQPVAPIQITLDENRDPLAFASSDGALKVTVSGGTPPYAFAWSDGTNTEDLENIPKGSYTLIVTDAENCQKTQSYTVMAPDLLEVGVQQTAEVLCNGENTGSLLAIGTGGVRVVGVDYYYQWFKEEAGSFNPITGAYYRELADQPAGTYKVEIEDDNGIKAMSLPITITEPTALNITGMHDHVLCHGGVISGISLEVGGGIPPYTYSWSHGPTTRNVEMLTAGDYTVTMTDQNGCELRKTFVVEQPVAPLSGEVIVQNPLAFSRTDGFIDLKMTGGTTPYFYRWTDDKGGVIGDEARLENLGKGTYKVIVTDNQGCIFTQIYQLEEPPLLQVNIMRNQIIFCKDAATGSLTAIGEGGVPAPTSAPYRYQWIKDGGAYATTATIDNLKAGVYEVILVDQNGISVRETFQLTEPEELELVLTSSSPVDCEKGAVGSIVSSVQGGTPPYTYQWNTGASSIEIDQLYPGNYYLFITDQNGCEIGAKTEITSPSNLSGTIEKVNPSCSEGCDGKLKVNIAGGSPPYSYKWKHDSRLQDTNLENLCAGLYQLEIIDSEGCGLFLSAQLESPAPLTVNLGEDITLCQGQVHTVDAGLGNEGIAFVWKGDNGFESEQQIVDLDKAGTYEVTVINESGCVSNGSITIKQSNKEIEAEFLVTTQTFLNQEIVLVNVNNPMPEQSSWVVPDGLEIIEETEEKLVISAQNKGSYTIGLLAREGLCTKYYEKEILIYNEAELPATGEVEDPFIREFICYPNPNTGIFQAKIQLAEEATICLRLIQILSNTVVDELIVKGSDYYLEDYDLSHLPAGLYLLVLETPKGSQVFKVVKK